VEIMKKSHRKREVGAYAVVVIGIIVVILAILCKFGLISGVVEIEIPRNDVIFIAKEMPENLPMIPVSREGFKKLDLGNEKKICFLDVDSNLKVIKIWTIADKAVFFYTERIEGYPLLTNISDIDIRFLSHINKMQIILQ